MNLQQLNGGTPNGKLWLNPVVNQLTANKVITAVSPTSSTVFSLYRNVSASIPPTFVTAPCNLVGIDNPDMSVLTNSYTASQDCYLSVSLGLVVSWQITATAIVCQLDILVNGVPSYIQTNYRDGNLGGLIGSVPIQTSGILKLSAGDVVGVAFGFNGVGTGFSYDRVVYSGFIV
jgi:hypothetical protein